ncbi:MAG: sphingomyelin phosphodiesterase [Bacteroidales bacterium]
MSYRTIVTLLINSLLIVTGLSVYGNQRNISDSLTMDTITCNSVKLKILSWNIGMLPALDLFNEKHDRAEAIAIALSSCDYDIIVFQEAFTVHSRAVLTRTLYKQYPYAYGPANKSGLSIKFNSGIWVLSKVPLQTKKEIEFTSSAGFDSFARKGAVLFEGQFHNSSFQLIATHLQDDEFPQTIRNHQLEEIFEKLIIPFSDMNTPQIICGDFNTDEKNVEDYTGMLTILNAKDGAISGNMKITFDDESNDAYQPTHGDPRLIDYILTRNSGVIQWISRRVAILKLKWGSGTEYLSDHHGIEAVFVFRKGDYLTKVN